MGSRAAPTGPPGHSCRLRWQGSRDPPPAPTTRQRPDGGRAARDVPHSRDEPCARRAGRCPGWHEATACRTVGRLAALWPLRYPRLRLHRGIVAVTRRADGILCTDHQLEQHLMPTWGRRTHGALTDGCRAIKTDAPSHPRLEHGLLTQQKPDRHQDCSCDQEPNPWRPPLTVDRRLNGFGERPPQPGVPVWGSRFFWYYAGRRTGSLRKKLLDGQIWVDSVVGTGLPGRSPVPHVRTSLVSVFGAGWIRRGHSAFTFASRDRTAFRALPCSCMRAMVLNCPLSARW